MDNDTLIYLFFIVGSLALSIYRNSKKAKEKQKAADAQPKENDFFENLMKEISQTEEVVIPPKPQPVPEPVSKPVMVTELQKEFTQNAVVEKDDAGFEIPPVYIPDYSNYQFTYEENPAYTEIPKPDFQPDGFVEGSEHKIIPEPTADAIHAYEWENNEEAAQFQFEPAKAVIYSEIMRRPEW